MDLTIIAAISENGVIGNNETDEKGLEKYAMPWPRIQGDMKRFQRLTKGHPVVMGRKTYESLPKFVRPLKKRKNIVMTRNSAFSEKGIHIAYNLEEALKMCESEKSYIMGGSEIYRQFLPLSDRMEVTWIHNIFEGNVLFPKVEWENWSEIKRESHLDEKTGMNYSFTTYTRRMTA